MEPSSPPPRESKRAHRPKKRPGESYDSDEIDEEIYLSIGAKVEAQFQGAKGMFLLRNFGRVISVNYFFL